MTGPVLALSEHRHRLGLKGPRAAEWLTAHGVALPTEPNTWTHSVEPSASDALLVARLGTGEFFLEDVAAGSTLKRMAFALDGQPPGVYPVLREDWAFRLGGEAVHDVLAQVCNVNFSALPLHSNPVIMTLMIGVAVLVVPQSAPDRRGVAAKEGGAAKDGEAAESVAERHYRIWCDPTFGPYLGESLGAVVIECGGSYRG
jgi:sarcosine oxidase, subunit gamma